MLLIDGLGIVGWGALLIFCFEGLFNGVNVATIVMYIVPVGWVAPVVSCKIFPCMMIVTNYCIYYIAVCMY